MILIPKAIFINYAKYLATKNFTLFLQKDYLKWLRYYLDFCEKYPVPDSTSERVRLFSNKLREKKQNDLKIEEAVHAVSLYFEMQTPSDQAVTFVEAVESSSLVIQPDSRDVLPSQSAKPPVLKRTSNYSDSGYALNTDSSEWDAVLAVMAGEIKVRGK